LEEVPVEVRFFGHAEDHYQWPKRPNIYKRKANMEYKTAAADVSSEGLLESLLDVLSNTNGILATIAEVEFNIHEAKADGEPVSSSANEVIGLLDSVRGSFESARDTLLSQLDVMVPKKQARE
jgi:hypothetical protein